jgi:hypothetical protein
MGCIAPGTRRLSGACGDLPLPVSRAAEDRDHDPHTQDLMRPVIPSASRDGTNWLAIQASGRRERRSSLARMWRVTMGLLRIDSITIVVVIVVVMAVAGPHCRDRR